MLPKRYSTIVQKLGLTVKEVSVYFCLLEFNNSLASQVSKKTGIKRSNCYVVLENLVKKGLVGQMKKGQYNYFQALDPSVLIEKKQSEIEEFKSILPELENLFIKFPNKPEVSLFQGRDGVIQVMEDTLRSSTELLSWGDVAEGTSDLLESYYPEYVKKKVKNKVYLRGIFAYSKEALTFKKRGKEELRECYLIPREKFPFKNEVIIYEDKLAIISHEDSIAVLIQNENIASTQRTMFNFAYEYAKMIEPEVLNEDDLKFLRKH